jgi:hypothetical protein
VIFYLSTERFSTTIRYFVDFFRDRLRGVVVPLSYEELFFESAAPIGHYIFTDFDRLSRYELECAAAFAGALIERAPEARILNHPLKVLERHPLLVALHRAAINDFSATRLETGERPPRYPVFIRAEDGYGGPETDLLNNDAEFDAALEKLTQRGLPRRGRLAVGFANALGCDGLYRKYGAFNIGGSIVPHDLMFGRNWVVKVRASDGSLGHDAEYGDSPQGIAEELHFVRGNPHRDVLRRAFAIAGMDYGRADYGVVKGQVQIYEINTNPHLPHQPSPDKRQERRDILDRSLVAAIKAIDTPLGIRGRLRFVMPRPKLHNLHWPRRRLPVSLLRRAVDFLR